MIADERIPAHQRLNLLEELAAAPEEEFFEVRVQFHSPESGIENGDSSPPTRPRNRIQVSVNAPPKARSRRGAAWNTSAIDEGARRHCVA
jgi:hypothetical protein